MPTAIVPSIIVTMQRPDPVRYWQGQTRDMPHRGIRDPSIAGEYQALAGARSFAIPVNASECHPRDKELGRFLGMVVKFMHP